MKTMRRLYAILSMAIICCCLNSCMWENEQTEANIAGYHCCLVTTVNHISIPDEYRDYENAYWLEKIVKHFIVSEWTDDGPKGKIQLSQGYHAVSGRYFWQSDTYTSSIANPITYPIKNDGTHFSFAAEYFDESYGWTIIGVTSEAMLIVSEKHKTFATFYNLGWIDEATVTEAHRAIVFP